jgi:hypothetical protein
MINRCYSNWIGNHVVFNGKVACGIEEKGRA